MTVFEALVRENPESVVIYSNGLVHCSVCAPGTMAMDEVAAAVNAQNPTGLDDVPWEVSGDAVFRSGEPNPAPCNSVAGRVHWLMVC